MADGKNPPAIFIWEYYVGFSKKEFSYIFINQRINNKKINYLNEKAGFHSKLLFL